MAISSNQVTHLDIMAHSGVEPISADTESPKEELLTQEITSVPDLLPIMYRDLAREGEKSREIQELDRIQESADVKETGLGSPFSSPKPVTDDCKSAVSLEEREIGEDKADKSVVANPGLAQKEGVRFDEKAESSIASPIVKEESVLASTPEVQADAETDVEIANEDSDSKTSIEGTVEAPQSAKPTHSLPPHMRPDFQSPSPRQSGFEDPRHMLPVNEFTRFNEGPRAPRSHYSSYPPRGDHMDREQPARISAQLMKSKHELDAERNKNLRLRKTIESELQQKVETASSSMLTNLLREQAEALTVKAKVEARERELDLREQKISQLEVYLSEGQKQLWFSLEANGVRPMNAVQMQHARREAELIAQKAIADVNAKLNIKIEGLRLREAAQQMREQQYKAMIRESLLAEFTENSFTSEKADEIAEIEYNNGFGAGKEAGRREAQEKSHHRGFLQGYNACHRTQVTLSKFRQGQIPCDSLDLDFLYDANHPHNLYNVGALFGQMEAEAEANASKKGEEVKVELKKPIANGSMHNVAEDTGVMPGRMNDGADRAMVQKGEEPIRKMPPARLTFAAELRGSLATHNGHVVLANNAVSPVAKEVERPVIECEGDGVNLIDLL